VKVEMHSPDKQEAAPAEQEALHSGAEQDAAAPIIPLASSSGWLSRLSASASFSSRWYVKPLLAHGRWRRAIE